MLSTAAPTSPRFARRWAMRRSQPPDATSTPAPKNPAAITSRCDHEKKKEPRARCLTSWNNTIVLEEAQDGGWSALAPDLPGLLIAGDTREELLASAPDALATYLEAMRDLGHPVPRPGSRVAQVRVSEA